MTDLIKYDAARHALQQAVEIDDVKNIRDKAQAMAAYARQANDTKLVEWATEIKVRAERKAGQMLSEMPKNPGKLKNSSWSHDTTTTKLSDLNITKDQSSRWQRLAAVPDDQFEKAISAAKEVAGEVTTAAMLRIEKALKDHKSSQGADVGETIMPNAIKQITPQKNKLQNSQEEDQEKAQIQQELYGDAGIDPAAELEAAHKEIERLTQIIESDDQLAEANKEIKRLSSLCETQQFRINSLMSEKAEAVRYAKLYKSKLEKLEKQVSKSDLVDF